jgi:hypothetical protein
VGETLLHDPLASELPFLMGDIQGEEEEAEGCRRKIDKSY